LAPDGEDWAIEPKLDGMRAQVRVAGRSFCVRSRPGRDCTAEFPELAPLANALSRRQVLLDGELVCFGEDGRPDFELLRRRLRASRDRASSHAARAPARYAVFDLLHLNGRSTRALPYAVRRELLADLAIDGPAWFLLPHWIGDRDSVVNATRDQGLEGVVAQRLDSAYEAAKRSARWIKQKHRRRERMLVTGWAPSRPGQLETFTLARSRSDGQPEPAGSASYDLDAETRERLRALFQAEALPPRRRNQRVRWIEPGVVSTVDFHQACSRASPRRHPARRSWTTAHRRKRGHLRPMRH
jgi:bifunctional non-homologous end joining protein LigD